MRYAKEENIKRKKVLLSAIGNVVKEKRAQINKGILLLSYEYDIPSTSLAKLEKGICDVQISTLWKLSEALGMTFSEFIEEVQKKLPQNFKLTED